MITAEQIRASRGALGWSAEELANHSEIARRTLVAIERANGVPSANTLTLQKIQSALESAGIEFIGTANDGPGIRIHSR